MSHPGSPPRPHPGEQGVSRDLLYRSLFEHALLEVHIWSVVRDERGAIATWRLVDANAAALKSWGRALDDVVGKTTDEIFPGADAVRLFLPIVEEIIGSGRPKEWETGFSGTGQVLHMTSIPVGDFFVSTGFDVTAERRRQRELQDALRSLNQATQAGGVGLWDWDLRTNQVRYSDEWKRQLGYAPSEIANEFAEWQDRVHPDDLAPTLARVQAKIADPTLVHDVVFRMRHKDGSYRWILSQASIIPDEGGQPERMLGSHVDITERRRLEERVLEAQKLESVGTLAAGIAHDFNNLLSAITGNLSLLRGAPGMAPQLPALLKEMDDAARRATALTKQLLSFAKGGSPVREVTSIGDLIVQAATFVTRGSNTRCEFTLADDLHAVEADVGQISQVVDNLVINAMQAMPQGGTVRISAANLSIEPDNQWQLAPGPYVRFSVEDQGAGIPADVLPRIFDPFFTTKSAGSGLGLSSSYAIVSRHGGRINVHSTPGQGATFDVLLPASGVAPTASEHAQAVAGSGRILVMDDDDVLRSIFKRMLEHLGYECDLSRHGDEAIRLYTEAMSANRPYRAVILDLTVPGHPGGVQVLADLRRIDPTVVAIVASGYAEDDALAHYQQHGFRGRVLKPIDLALLSQELARVTR